MRRKRIREMEWWEKIDHAKQVREEAKRRAAHVIRRLSTPRPIRTPTDHTEGET